MARALTKKQRKFVNEYAETGNGVKSALKAYNTADYGTANAIATENLQKPAIIQELNALGFNENTAKEVVSDILQDETVEPQHRLKASELVFKVEGSFAPERHLNVNVDIPISEEDMLYAKRLQALERDNG